MAQITIPNLGPGSGAGDIVRNGWTAAQNYASSAVTNASGFLDAIRSQAGQLATLPVLADQLGAVSRAIGVYVAPTAPVAPTDLAFVTPAAPLAPTLGTIAAFDAGTAPVFGAIAPVIDLNIAAPATLAASTLAAPLLGSIAIPDAPVLTLPLVPTLLGITVPVSPLLAMPTFTAVLPGSPLAPAYIFSFAESAYTSTLLEALRAKLTEWVNGAATGLNPLVEQALWDRGRAREAVNAAQKALEAVRAFASRGFAKPPGMLAVELARAQQAGQDANSTLSRDIMVKQAELEQSNRKFAFEQAFKVEAELITYNGQIAQRAFDGAKHAQQVGIDIYRDTVARYGVDVQAYSAQVDQWKQLIQSELTKLEKYRSDLEGQKMIGEMNSRSVDIYRSRVEASRAVIDVFKAQVDSVNAQASINKTQIESYAAQVGAYAESVRAKSAEYEGYATRVKAEVSKADAFKSQAEVYGIQVEGFKSLVDARIASKSMEIKLGVDVPMDLFKTRTEVYRTAIAAESGRVGAVADVFGKQVQAYSAQVQGQVGRMGAESEAYRSDVQYQQAAANVRIEVAKSNIATLVQKMGLLIDAAKAGGQVSAQMAASALSSVNLSGSLSDSASVSQGANYGLSESFSVSNSIGTSTSTSTSTSNSTSNSTGNSTNYNYAR